VLVSLLEPESELYNSGIVDVSHRYHKMYVVRPQFFAPLITVLRNAALNALRGNTPQPVPHPLHHFLRCTAQQSRF
jgi:hypothetical protein